MEKKKVEIEKTFLSCLRKHKKVSLSILGVLSGLINGLLGAGGGILLVRFIGKIVGAESDEKDVFATALATMLPLSVVSTFAYIIKGSMIEFDIAPIFLPAVVGGVGGALLLNVIDTRLLRLVFSALVVFSGINMLF